MADNVAITAGSGTTIATDDVGSGVQVQRIKVMLGADGANDGDVAAANPMPTGGLMTKLTATPTVSASPAYTAGDCVGGLMTLSNAVRSGPLSGVLAAIEVMCKSAQTFAFDVIFFDANPSGSTLNDNAAIAIAAADFDKIVGVAQITGTAPNAWVNVGTPSFAVAANVNLPLKLASTTLYAVLVARGTPTLGSTSDIKFAALVYQD